MSFDRTELIEHCRVHGHVARIVVAGVRGSAPREVGAAMLVWSTGATGTIGGGTLEHQATLAARKALGTQTPMLRKHALGPDMGQCCGGAVELFTDIFDLASAEQLSEDIVCRGSGEMPLTVRRLVSGWRTQGSKPETALVDGWMIEPVLRRDRPVWIWGAGHVGRAIVDVMHPLPDISMVWVDTDRTRFPDHCPRGVEVVPTADPAALVRHAPMNADHLIVTFSHALDLELCHRLLGHGFAFAGLIGSKTKWARFRSRLSAMGHGAAQVDRITCPIGDPTLGKHPHSIALGVAVDLLCGQQSVEQALKGLG